MRAVAAGLGMMNPEGPSINDVVSEGVAQKKDVVGRMCDSPPRHWSIFNPCQATSLKGKSRFKLPYFGCQLGCHFLKSLINVLFKPWGHRLV